jgi:hypothetical protein
MKKAAPLALALISCTASAQQIGGDRDILPQSQTASSDRGGQAHCPL